MGTIAISAFTATCLAGLERARRPGRPRRVRRLGAPLAERGRRRGASGQARHDGVATAPSRARVQDAPAGREGTLCSRSVRSPHEDRADPRLAATAAAVHELTLVTADERRLRGRGSRRLADR